MAELRLMELAAKVVLGNQGERVLLLTSSSAAHGIEDRQNPRGMLDCLGRQR
jgi:hypothetical protein